MSLVPKADKIQTPAQYGAVAPPGDVWPINQHGLYLYAVNRIYPTIQGEGGMVGTPMTIVRLQGCPVGCVFCDTPESWSPTGGLARLTGLELASSVNSLPPRWALVTGGEPTWHDLFDLTKQLHRHEIKCALETAGVYPATGMWDWVTLSPKPAGLMPFKPAWIGLANEIKWIVGKETDVEDLYSWMDRYQDEFSRGMHYRKSGPRISLQPMSASPKATDICIATLMRQPHWHLSLQTHKMTGIA